MGKKIGRNPTDRGKSGVKRSVLTDGAGIPLAVVAAPANKLDFQLVRETLETIPIERPAASEESPQGMCMDKGYDYSEVEALLKEFSYTAHIRARGEERKLLKESGHRARRWVVERTHSWMNRFRRILVRWEKKLSNFLGLLHLACSLIVYRAARRPI